MELESAYKCESCETVYSADDDLSPLYECGQCGTAFTRENSADGDGNRCPDCSKFGAKVADVACPDCEEELIEVQAAEIDGELVAIEGDGDPEALVAEAAERNERERRERAEAEERRLAEIAAERERYAGAPVKLLRDIKVGDVILVEWPSARIEAREVVAVEVSGERVSLRFAGSSLGMGGDLDDGVKYVEKGEAG